MRKIGIIALFIGIAAGVMAYSKGRNGLVWGAVCAMMPLAIIILWALPDVTRPGVTRKCSSCGTVSDTTGLTCPKCSSAFAVDLVQCPKCKRYVSEARYCSECGSGLR